MKTVTMLAAATMIAATSFAMAGDMGNHMMSNSMADPMKANKMGVARTELVRHDLDAMHEAIQVLVDLDPGVAFPRHSHPGTEIAHVDKGEIQYQFDGQAPVTLKAGDSLFIPEGTIHSARNVGSGKASELATYIVEKEKPVVVLAK